MTDHNYPEKVTIHRVGGSYNSGWIPENIREAIDFLEEKLQEIPEQYRKDAKIEFDSYAEYDSFVMNLEIYYNRPPTQEEIDNRQNQERIRLKAELNWAQDNLNRINKQLGVK